MPCRRARLAYLSVTRPQRRRPLRVGRASSCWRRCPPSTAASPELLAAGPSCAAHSHYPKSVAPEFSDRRAQVCIEMLKPCRKTRFKSGNSRGSSMQRVRHRRMQHMTPPVSKRQHTVRLRTSPTGSRTHLLQITVCDTFLSSFFEEIMLGGSPGADGTVKEAGAAVCEDTRECLRGGACLDVDGCQLDARQQPRHDRLTICLPSQHVQSAPLWKPLQHPDTEFPLFAYTASHCKPAALQYAGTYIREVVPPKFQ